MTKPFLLIQLSDPHIGASWVVDVDPLAGLLAAVESVRRLPDPPDAVLVTGDLADSASDAEYVAVQEALASLDVPAFVLPGNHDNRDALRRHFGLPGESGTPIQYSVDLGSLRLVLIDTTKPGLPTGELDASRLAWLDVELSHAPQQPTLIAMHHPPLVTGVVAWDEIGLPATDRFALGEIISKHPQVHRLVGGHVHRTIAAELAGRTVLSVSSTFAQAALDFDTVEIRMILGSPAFAVHALIDGVMSSHVESV